jgi:hypothetical protein
VPQVVLPHLGHRRTGMTDSLSSMDSVDGRRTHGICYIHIRRGDLPALLVSFFHLHHIPDTESCAGELRPDIAPAFVLVRFVATWGALELVDEGTGEIDLLCVCHK